MESYIPVSEFLNSYGVSILQIVDMASNGILTIYRERPKYIPIENFNLYVENWIFERKKYLENEKDVLLKKIKFIERKNIRERSRFAIYGDNYEHYYDICDKEINLLDNIDGTKARIIFYSYIKLSEFEEAIKNNKKRKRYTNHNGSKKPIEIIKLTKEKCEILPSLYKEVLLIEGKPGALRCLRQEMDGREPHQETVDVYYHQWAKRGIARGQGRPKKQSQSA